MGNVRSPSRVNLWMFASQSFSQWLINCTQGLCKALGSPVTDCHCAYQELTKLSSFPWSSCKVDDNKGNQHIRVALQLVVIEIGNNLQLIRDCGFGAGHSLQKSVNVDNSLRKNEANDGKNSWSEFVNSRKKSIVKWNQLTTDKTVATLFFTFQFLSYFNVITYAY